MRSARPRRSYTHLAIGALLALATLAVYSRALRFGFVNYDDPDYVTANTHVQAGITRDGVAWAFTHSFAGNWLPMTWISHMLDVDLYGLDSGRHHLTSIVIHVLAAILLFAFLRRVTEALWPSAAVAAIFALHPLHVESVAWIAERKDVLCALFWMLTLCAHAAYAARPGAVRYGLALLAFACALMAKPMAVTLPMVLVLLDYWPFRRGLRVVEKIPFLAFSAAVSVVTFLVHKEAGATAPLDVFPLAMRLENAMVSYAVYAIRMFWPANLAVFYPYPQGSLALPAALAAIALAAITAASIRMARERPYLIVGWLWYLVTLAPVIGVLQVGAQARADRYAYIPSIGLSIAVIWGAAELLQKRPRALAIAGWSVCAACAALTWFQVAYWKDGESLFRHAAEATTDNYVAQFNLASVLDERGASAEAASHLAEAVRIKPNWAAARAELGQLLAKQGQLPEALVQLRAAVNLSPSDASAHHRLGSVLGGAGKEEEAIGEFREAVRLDPANADAHYNLGIALANREKFAEAAMELEAAVRSKPADAGAHFSLGAVLLRLGRASDSIAQLSESLRIDPRTPGARELLEEAVALERRGRK